MYNFTEKEATVLDYIQRGVPLVREPFAEIANELNFPKEDIFKIIENFKGKDVIRNIAGIFDGKKIGYYLSLVALKVEKSKVEETAKIVSSHPGVSHNYLRDNEFNIWFTLADENNEMFNQSLEIIKKKSNPLDCLVLENKRLLKIGVILDLGNKNQKKEFPKKKNFPNNKIDLLPLERETIKILQNDLPLVERPFALLCEEFNEDMSEDELLQTAEVLRKKGIMRRYSAVLRHRSVGYNSNAMTVWKNNSFSEEQLNIFVKEPAISHLYLRTIYPGRWEYPLFAMIHAKTEMELQQKIDLLATESGIEDCIVLKTLKEFKKERVKYFSSEFNKWRLTND